MTRNDRDIRGGSAREWKPGLRLGTRGSELALAQSAPIAAALDAEVVVISTSGDTGATGDKSRWIDTIEKALLAGEIDCAVHSAKDVPGQLAPGLAIVAATSREDARDALVGAKALAELPRGARVGTTSPRRRAQLLAARPDLEIVALHGNVDTRLRKLDQGDVDAIVLAAAGLRRLGREDAIGALLDFVPAPGQGTLVIEAREGFDAAVVCDQAALDCLFAEREIAALLGATCDSAVGIRAARDTIEAWVGAQDGSTWIADRIENGAPSQLAERMTAMGASNLIR